MKEGSSEAVGTFELPVVDFAPFSSASNGAESPSPEQQSVANAIDNACRTHGFVCLRNTGIARQALATTFDASQNLFGMTHELKAGLKQLDPIANIGYNGLGSEALNRRRAADLKEVFNVRQPDSNPDLFQGTPPGFQEASTQFWEQITLLSQQFSKCCAVALGLDLDYFSKTMTKMDLCTLRMLCYPPCPTTDSDAKDPSSSIRVGEHTDFGAYTFLFVHNLQDKSSHGLQVKPIEGGDLGCGSLVNRSDDMFISGWKDVIFDEATLAEMAQDDSCSVLVNTGALMARWTNDVWRATAHRVIVKPEARNSYRYSIAVFFDPDKETICSVHPKFVPQGQQPKYPPIQSLEYLLMKLREAQGAANENDNKGSGNE
ncbi:oxoglutarate-dependent dioxygenase [Seminavis robusta]|uniref:Oxoglutarate-dependent dioxygenase n=1 Tax=Seminavis robusta TaxID=568900 RepID=A0A9N8HGY1_9STRA|nr:oxoglutarate-dependent dioxygenase [Seminavis robusta]|eukprot:Sro668_g184260.1 oxoglutarate-dependent dioxygenase (374) ;mRNA; r:2894-4015